MITSALLGAALSLLQTEARILYDQPIDSLYRLRIAVTYRSAPPNTCCSSYLRVLLVDSANANRYWEVTTVEESEAIVFEVQRIDTGSVVLSRKTTDHGIDRGNVKLFFETQSKRLVKRIDFDTPLEIRFPSDAVAQQVLNVSPEGLKLLRERRALNAVYLDPVLPAQLVANPPPQSTYRTFAQARPERVTNGYTESDTTIEERVGAYQVDSDRIWVAKTFYDGEGVSGVGGVGHVDASGRYSFLSIPLMVDWSARSLLVEGDSLYVGRVRNGEGAEESGGLLQYNLRTGESLTFPVPDPIHSITRLAGRLFLGTTRGLCVVQDGSIVRYRSEPDTDGRLGVVSERR
jgi:hypothetical protein